MKFNYPSNGFNLRLHKDDGWVRSTERVLIILETVPSEFIEEEEIDDKVISRCVSYALGEARRLGYKGSPSFAIVNFNDYKHFHLKGSKRAAALTDFRTRTDNLIEELKPTRILFSGDLSQFIPTIRHAKEKSGWVLGYKGIPIVGTLDFAKLLMKQGANANLLGFWCRHLSNLLNGKLPYNLSHINPKTMGKLVVDSIPRFDKLMALWDKNELIAVDTETRNLSVLKNAILTIQFCFGSSKDKGYLLIIDHPHEGNPFSAKDRAYIKAELGKRFAGSDKELITFNGIFDLRIIRRALNVPIIGHRVWEIQAGEHLLDENISSLASVSHKGGGLAAVFCMYGNDSYLSGEMAFSKGERSNTAGTPPNDPDFVSYAILDVVSIMNIRDMQLLRAEHQDLLGKPYKDRFVNHMHFIMSDTVHQLSHMKETGSLIDRKYLRSLLRADSPLVRLVADLERQVVNTPAGKEASRRLSESQNIKGASLFGTAPDLLKLGKPAHRALLFLEVLGLEAVNKTATGEPSIDSAFLDKYKNQNPVVSLYADYQEASKILSTYVKGWEKNFQVSLDGEDSHLRADFTFFGVDTGRLASSGPNFQNIPSRGKLAKIIKEMFIAADGTLLISFDYSAHEVRGWSIVANDLKLADTFRVGQALRQKLIKLYTPELATMKFPLASDAVVPKKLQVAAAALSKVLTELKTKGDVHIQNVFRFFGKWVEKSNPLRDAVKSVVFGTLYGKSAKSLGDDTKKAEFDVIKAKLRDAKTAEEIAKLERQFEDLVAEDRKEQAQDIIDKMFNEFTAGHRWVLRMQESAKKRFYVYSPIGRIRHLFAAMTGEKSIIARQVRRGLNAPIQGFASELAVKGSRLVLLSTHDFAKKAKLDMSKFRFSRMVHDASYYAVPYHLVLPFIHILQYETTYGVSKAVEKEFGLKMTIEPEIEINLGTKDTNSDSWNWALPNLLAVIDGAVTEGIKNGLLTESKEDILAQIYKPWKDDRTLTYLNKKYPLLGVDLKTEIEALMETV